MDDHSVENEIPGDERIDETQIPSNRDGAGRLIVDLPQQIVPPSPEADLKALAENMSDAEMRALVIQNFRMLNEIVGFVRMAATTLEALGTLGPAKSRLAGAVVPAEAMELAKQQAAASAALRGNGQPPRNRAERRAQR